MRKSLMGVVAILSLMLVGSVAGWNHYEYSELSTTISYDGTTLAPVLSENNELLISSSLYVPETETVLRLPVMDIVGSPLEDQINLRVSTVVGVADSQERYYIGLVTPTSPQEPVLDNIVMGAHEFSGYPGIYAFSMDTKGQSSAHLLLLPLINFPVGTEGYTIPLQELDGRLVIPLIVMPKGHSKNHHGDVNEWGIQYDKIVSLYYTVVH